MVETTAKVLFEGRLPIPKVWTSLHQIDLLALNHPARALSTPAASAAALAALLQDEPGEVFAILCLSTKHRVIV
jgi:DNA repair protein RadC